MKPLGWVVAVLCAIIFGALWLRAHDARVRATAKLVERDAQLDSLARSLSENERFRIENRRRTDSLLAANKTRMIADSLLADSLRIAGTVRYLELRGTLSKDQRLLLDSIVQTFARERSAKDSIIAVLNDAVITLQAERVSGDSLIVSYRKALTFAVEQRDGWKQQASRRDWIACGPGLGVSLRGPGLGVGCVLNLL